MIFDVHGDILLSKAAAIAHGVAPNDNFHTGLALQLRERFPAMYKDFRHYCQSTHAKAGEIWAWSGLGAAGAPVHLVALMTQDGGYEHGNTPGRAHLDHVNHALRQLHKWIEREKPASIAIPRLATGVGGLAWKDVHPLLTQHLAGAGIPVYVYADYRPGVAAAEPVMASRA
jgi:O-acetyl-ADP-ribose deacetylase (regulator of RNase III)